MQQKTLGTFLTVFAFIIGLVGLVMGIMIMSGNETVIDAAITFTIACMLLAAGAAVLFGLFHFVTNFKQNMGALIGVVVLVILGFICYSLADAEVLRSYPEGITASESKWSEAGLIFTYILIIAALAVAIIGEVIRMFK